MNINVKSIALLVILAPVLAACANGLFFATPTPTAVPTPTTDPLGSAKVVQAFWDALGAGDLDTAISYVADDVQCSGFCHFTGKVVFQSYLQGYLDAGYVTKIGDLKSIGSIVTYSWEVTRNGLFIRRGDTETMQVENGKIVFWENNHR